MTSRSSDTIEIFFKEYPNCGMTLIPQRIPQPQPQSFDDRYRNRNSGSGWDNNLWHRTALDGIFEVLNFDFCCNSDSNNVILLTLSICHQEAIELSQVFPALAPGSLTPFFLTNKNAL